MLEMIPGYADDIVAVEAVGTVEAADYGQVLDPAIAAALRDHEKVRVLFVLGDRYEGYSAAAMLEDAKLGSHDLSRWERIAVVTDHTVLRDAIRMFGWLMPCEVRTYGVGQRADATAWISDRKAA